MLFMPFQILGAWLRALFALALIGGAATLLTLWYNHRTVEVVEVEREAPPPDRPGDPPVEREVVRHEPWQLGLNRATAFLVGGLTLLVWSLCGWLVRPLLTAARGGMAATPDRRPGEQGALRRDDGTELHVETYGPADAPVLVLTHGWSLDRDEWCYARQELGDRFRLITWDLPGLGRSSRPANNDYSLERMARDLDAVIGLAGGRPVVLVGHSIGGMIQLTYCRLFPEAMGERVRGMVIAQSTYTNPVRTAKGAELLAPLQRPVLEPLCHVMVWLSPLFRVFHVLSYLNGSAHRHTESSSLSGRETRGQLEYLTRYFLTSSPAVVARGFLAMFRYDATDVLPAVRVPTLIVAGDRDTQCLPDASAEMAATIPGARLVTLSDAKHAGVFEHHRDFHAHVEAFAEACLAGRGAAAGVV